MVRNTLFTSLLASSALVLAVATPAFADKKDRAQEAIAAAEAKLHTAESLGTGVEVPAATAAARASLLQARESLSAGHKSVSIEQSIRAQSLADTAIGELQRRKDASVVAARESARATAEAARETERASAAQAQDRVAEAQDQTAAAREQAAAADARADAAQQAAASSAADAAAARNAATAALAAQPAAQVETTITTQHRGAVRRTTKSRVVRPAPKPASASVATTTDQVTATTTVTPR